MKIDEACIDHNVTRLIDELDMWGLEGAEMSDIRLITIGYIKGITEFAKAMKEVLNA